MKILILRFSSIGDIVLTTPVVRCLKEQIPDTEIHYCTKEKFRSLVASNPYVDKVIALGDSFSTLLDELFLEKYDLIVDLHKNLRTWQIKTLLFGVKSVSFEKLNFKKWLKVKFKKNFMPDIHIVDRYLHAVASLSIQNDGRGLDYFFTPGANLPDSIADILPKTPFVVYVSGGTYATKRLSKNRMHEMFTKINLPVVVIGDAHDNLLVAECLTGTDNKVLNLCGKLSLSFSSQIVKLASIVVTHDTGLMHIAAALKKPVVSIWGNTIPQFGMTPYYPKDFNTDLTFVSEVTGLKCRPCSKLGFAKCPQGHFRCMEQQNIAQIVMNIDRISASLL